MNASPQDDRPVEDLVNEPTELKEKSLEINTNKGKLVVTTSTDGKELKNVVLEVKPDKNDVEKVDDAEDPSKKVRVSSFSTTNRKKKPLLHLLSRDVLVSISIDHHWKEIS